MALLKVDRWPLPVLPVKAAVIPAVVTMLVPEVASCNPTAMISNLPCVSTWFHVDLFTPSTNEEDLSALSALRRT